MQKYIKVKIPLTDELLNEVKAYQQAEWASRTSLTRNQIITIDVLCGTSIADAAERFDISHTVARKAFLNCCQKSNGLVYEEGIREGDRTPSLGFLRENRYKFLTLRG